MKKVSFNVVCILAIVFPGIPKLKTPSFALGDHNGINKKLRQLMLHSIVLIAGLFISVDLFSQWERIPDFQCITQTAQFADSIYIWGGGNLGKAFRINSHSDELKYYQFDEDLDIYSVWYCNDSLVYLGGRDWGTSRGFFLFFDPLSDSIKHFISLPNDIWDIEFISQDTGFIVSFSGIHMTTSAGKTWEVIWDPQSSGSEYGELYSIISTSDGDLFAAGRKRQDLTESSSQGFILVSKDYGLNWNIVYEIPYGYITNLNFDFGKIYCHDKNHTFYYFSNDSGNTWEKVDIPIFDETLRIADVKYINENNIIACIAQDFFPQNDRSSYSIDLIINSTDSGSTWYLQFENHTRFPPRDTTLNKIISINDSTLFCLGWRLCLKTRDGGGQNNPIFYNHTKYYQTRKFISLFPNPSKDFIFLKGINQEYHYSIFSFDGSAIITNSKSFNQMRKWNNDILD
jgi:hypothetical protein